MKTALDYTRHEVMKKKLYEPRLTIE